MKKLLAIPLLASFALAAPTVERLKWDSFGASDSVTGIALKGAYSGAGLGVLRMNAASTAMELATPTGTDAPVNAAGANVGFMRLYESTIFGALGSNASLSFSADTGSSFSDLWNISAINNSRTLRFSYVNDAGSVATAAEITGSGLSVSGSLTASGPTTLQSTLSVTGNVSVNTDKFTVNASTGKAVSADTVAAVGLRGRSITLTADDNTSAFKISRVVNPGGYGQLSIKYEPTGDSATFTSLDGDGMDLELYSVYSSEVNTGYFSADSAFISSSAHFNGPVHINDTVKGSVVVEDSVTASMIKGTHRNVVQYMGNNDLAVNRNTEFVQVTAAFTANRFAELLNPADYGPGRCIQFNRNSGGANALIVDPGIWTINGSTGDITMTPPYSVLKVCTLPNASGVIDGWFIAYSNI